MMRSFAAILVALSTLVALAPAFWLDNEITNPYEGAVVVAGSTTFINWMPGNADPVTLVLGEDTPEDMQIVLLIVLTIASECTYEYSRVPVP